MSDQHQFSPNNIHRQSSEQVMRISKITSQGKMFLYLYLFKEMYTGNCLGIWGLRGSRPFVI